jgi:hypothetical protein
VRYQRIGRRAKRRGYGSPAPYTGSIDKDPTRRRRIHASSSSGNQGTNRTVHDRASADRYSTRRRRIHASIGSRDGNCGANGTANDHTSAHRDTASYSDTATNGDPPVNRDAPGYGDAQYKRGHFLLRQD